jgi:outer membrane protein OmpA-like peptidoglycan-associated protein
VACVGWMVLLRALCADGADPPSSAADRRDSPSSAVLSDQQIQQALRPPVTRSLGDRGLTRRDAVSPSVDLNIQFEYNSSTLRPEATQQLRQLQAALLSRALRNDRFLIAGHTDSRGRAEYNQQLSLRRAETVKRFLIGGGVNAARLEAVGRGAGQPLIPDRPEDPRNRRVQVQDLGESPR